MQKVIPWRARDQVRATMRDMIVAGEFAADERLDEIGLADRIGASRTPVREALIALEEEGLVESRPNHGFTVASVNELLVTELYPILGALEAAAVGLGNGRLIARAGELREINTRLRNEKRRDRRYELDRMFHRELAAHCANGRLLRLLEQNWNQARRIDGGQRRGLANLEGSCAEHSKIVEEIAAGKLAEAAREVREHWLNGQDVVLAWMRENL